MADKAVRVKFRIDMSGFSDAIREAARLYVKKNSRVERVEDEEE